MVRQNISKQKSDELAAHIGKVEQSTSGEIVCVLAQKSDPYQYIPILWAAFLALAVPFVFLMSDFFGNLLGLNGFLIEDGSYAFNLSAVSLVYMVQLVVFIVAFMAVQWMPLKLALVPKNVKLKRAKRLAAEQFMLQEINLTDDRTGVLLFVSMAEHYVEVIADHGIYEKLDPSIWQKIIDELLIDIKADKMADGLMKAIDEVGLLLQEHFPIDENTYKNELSNHIILID